MQIRYPYVAGSFYPAKPFELSIIIDNFLDQANPPPGGRLCALICPHAGYVFSGPVAAYGYKLLKNLEQTEQWRIILLGPSHFASFLGAAVSLADFWQTSLGQVKVLKDLGQQLLSKQIINLPTAQEKEHSLETQIPFLQKTLKNFAILPIVAGDINPLELAQILKPLITNQTLLIISSDLSHYYSYQQANILDNIANLAIPNLDIKKTEKEVEACGKIGILTLMHLARELSWRGQLLKYQNSGDTLGDKSRVVGYGAYAFYLSEIS